MSAELISDSKSIPTPVPLTVVKETRAEERTYSKNIGAILIFASIALTHFYVSGVPVIFRNLHAALLVFALIFLASMRSFGLTTTVKGFQTLFSSSPADERDTELNKFLVKAPDYAMCSANIVASIGFVYILSNLTHPENMGFGLGLMVISYIYGSIFGLLLPSGSSSKSKNRLPAVQFIAPTVMVATFGIIYYTFS